MVWTVITLMVAIGWGVVIVLSLMSLAGRRSPRDGDPWSSLSSIALATGFLVFSFALDHDSGDGLWLLAVVVLAAAFALALRSRSKPSGPA